TRWPRDWSSDVCSSDLKTVEEQFAEFVFQLRPSQREALEKFQLVSQKAELCRRFSPEDRVKYFKHPFTDDELQEILKDVEDQVRSEERRVGKECRARWW